MTRPTNRLDDWRSERKLTYRALGALIGVTGMAAGRYCRGLKVPEPRVLRRIIAATEGQVTPNDFFEEARRPERPTGKENQEATGKEPCKPLAPDALVAGGVEP